MECTVKPSRIAKTENSPYFLFFLCLNSFSCTPSGFILVFHLMQYTSPLLSCCLPALNRKLFSADLGEILPIMGKKCISLMAPFLRDTRLPHALISFFLSLLLSLSFFFLPLVLLHPPIFLQVPWLLMVPQHASLLLWGHSVQLHSSISGFCSTKHVTISCCVLQAPSKEGTKNWGADRRTWWLLLLD